MKEIYVSTDVETDGPIPGPHSMLSFGSAAYTADKQLVATFEANLHALPDTHGHPATMAWWETQAYVAWLRTLPGKPVFVGYPAGFDFLFIYWYLIRFAGESPFSFSALDIKTFAMATLGTSFRETTKKRMPDRWFDEVPHTHKALDDAIEQGALFCNILAENRKLRGQ
jgi:hypothetical protein